MAQPRPSAAAPLDLPYAVHVADVAGAGGEVVARAASSGLAYACYYACLREHHGQAVSLWQGDLRLAGASAPPPARS